MRDFKRFLTSSVFALLFTTQAFAQDTPSDHADNGFTLLPAHSALASDVHFFHNAVLMPIITVISVFVLMLLVYIVVRFRAKANPTPQKFTHNTMLEVIWTGVPILILLVIALFSFDLLYNEDVTPDGKQVAFIGDGATTDFVFPNDFESEARQVSRKDHIQVFVSGADGLEQVARADYKLKNLGKLNVIVKMAKAPAQGQDVIIRGGRTVVGGWGGTPEIAMAPSLTLKVNGYQWGWSYAYPDFGDFEYASNMLPENQTTRALYRLAVDNNVVVPVGETIRATTTARDVIHSWAMPNFAIKVDAVPGRINETWFKADKEGVFYGQCSEICGVKHSFMPIAVEVVSRERFEAWVDEQRELAGMEPMFSADTEKFAAVSAE